jgi:hypothetical protein
MSPFDDIVGVVWFLMVLIGGGSFIYFKARSDIEVCDKYYPELSRVTCVFSSKVAVREIR